MPIKCEQCEEMVEALPIHKCRAEPSVCSNELLLAAIELLAVAAVRGDDVLEHPSNDPLMWSARMQDAWVDLHEKIENLCPGIVDNEVEAMKAIE